MEQTSQDTNQEAKSVAMDGNPCSSQLILGLSLQPRSWADHQENRKFDFGSDQGM